MNFTRIRKGYMSPSKCDNVMGGWFVGEYTKCGENVPLSYHCANILAHLIDFLNR